jgi:hypothetical protein
MNDDIVRGGGLRLYCLLCFRHVFTAGRQIISLSEIINSVPAALPSITERVAPRPHPERNVPRDLGT